MQILESTETTTSCDGTLKTRVIEAKVNRIGKKDFSPIGRRHIDIKPGVEHRNFTSDEFQEFCEYHNYKLSSECIEIADKVFSLYPKRLKEMNMLITLLYGYDYVSQGIDDNKFHFNNPCSVQEVLSTLQGIYKDSEKLLRKFDTGLIQD